MSLNVDDFDDFDDFDDGIDSLNLENPEVQDLFLFRICPAIQVQIGYNLAH